MTSESEQEIPVEVTSLFGAQAQRGLVTLAIGDARTTMPPAKAREISQMLLECAEAADTDELLVRFFSDRIGLELEQAAMVLRDFRALRAQVAQRDTTDRRPGP